MTVEVDTESIDRLGRVLAGTGVDPQQLTRRPS